MVLNYKDKDHKYCGSSSEEEKQLHQLPRGHDQNGALKIVDKLATINKEGPTTGFCKYFLLFSAGCLIGLLQYNAIKSIFVSNSMQFNVPMMFNNNSMNSSILCPKKDEYILNCTSSNMTITCPANYPPTDHHDFTSNHTCPDYFHWIHEDLKNWKGKGIDQQMVESLKDKVHFRLVIVNGTAYVKRYIKAYQTRDTLTLWGILQLLKLYPGRIQYLDLMFQCHDRSNIKREHYPGEQAAFAPPQFHYCADESTLDIVFPDWSFWGWPEINVKPWMALVKEIEEGNTLKNWTSREPSAFWKGSTNLGPRKRLRACKDWHAQIVHQNWTEEGKHGFRDSDLSKQCLHRYKIYVEGNAWSVSEKYILACDSMTLLVDPIYYEFFTRSLIPMKHYWPISRRQPCKSFKFAVEWGNKNTDKAQEIGKAGSKFIFDHLKIEHVYDYMFHVLNEYAKLLKYKPTVPEGAVELCSETFACSPPGLEADYKIQTMVTGAAKQGPCNLPSPYNPNTLQTLRDQKARIKEVVEMWDGSS